MITNPQNTMMFIYKHIEPFYFMLDQLGRQIDSLDFPISAYERALGEYVRTLNDPAERTNVRRGLSVSNLNDCGFLTYVDTSRGAFNLQPFILDGIRSIESHRIRELGQPDLDFIHGQFLTVYRYFMSEQCTWYSDDVGWQEHLTTLIEVLHETLARIDRNVRALDGSANHLANILEQHNNDLMLPTEKVRKALLEVQHIYDRNIIPTLTFLTINAQVGEHSIMYLIKRIHERFRDTRFYKETQIISTVEMRLLSYSQEVSKIKKRMHHFLLMDQSQRALFEAVERRFNTLKNLCVDSLDERINNRNIDYADPFFDPSRRLEGMTRWVANTRSYRTHIEWPDADVRGLTLEHIRIRQTEAEAIKAVSTKTLHVKQRITEHERAQRKHIDKIIEVMKSFVAETETVDAYLAVHTHLVYGLEGYQLPDLYDALAMIDDGYTLVPCFRRATLQHEDYKLTYMINKLEPKDA